MTPRIVKHFGRLNLCWIALIAVLWLAFAGSLARADEAVALDPATIRVVDGDTIRIEGEASAVRLVGYDSPEIRGGCAAARAIGVKAKARLTDLIDSGPATLQIVACACRAGTEGTQRCNYGRSCGILAIEGVDVARTLIAEGLALPFICRGDRCPPKTAGWCPR